MALSVSSLTKTYAATKKRSAKEALKGVSLDIPKGSFFGLLGPNGAGKSTFINILAGLVNKTSGRVVINGWDIDTHMREAKFQIGIVPQELILDPFFTVFEALENHAGYYGVPPKARRTLEIIEALGLADKAHNKPRSLSGGMRRRLLIAKALVHTPSILILDEPTAGVDVELRQQLWDYVGELNRRGTTIILTTHYLEEAEALCDHIAIINHGTIIANEPKHQLMTTLNRKTLRVELESPVTTVPQFVDGCEVTSINERCFEIVYQPQKVSVNILLNKLQSEGHIIKDLTTREPNLEAVFKFMTQSKNLAPRS